MAQDGAAVVARNRGASSRSVRGAYEVVELKSKYVRYGRFRVEKGGEEGLRRDQNRRGEERRGDERR